jgi:hypothetical protein
MGDLSDDKFWKTVEMMAVAIETTGRPVAECYIPEEYTDLKEADAE